MPFISVPAMGSGAMDAPRTPTVAGHLEARKRRGRSGLAMKSLPNATASASPEASTRSASIFENISFST